MTVKRNQELQRLFDVELPRLLRKPTSKWTKADIWNAIALYFKRPSGGLINYGVYDTLEAKLKGEPDDPYYFPPPGKKGRPKKYTLETSQMQWNSMQRLRQQIAKEKKVAVEEVTYREVARRMAERAYADKDPKVPEFMVRKLADKYAIHYKSLIKKKKLGEI